MKLRAIIVDDEQRGINALKILLEKFSDEIKVVAESTNAYTAIDLINNYAPEVVFLDIQMPDLNGFELLEKLSWKNFHLVFITAHQDYGLRALKQEAIDYILKPMGYDDLHFTIQKIKRKTNPAQDVARLREFATALGNIYQTEQSRITIPLKYGVESIACSEIIFIESQSNYSVIQLQENKKITVSRTLKDFDKQLCDAGGHFMRVHHSFIVNLENVLRYLKHNDSIVMNTGQIVPVSKSRKPFFFNWLELLNRDYTQSRA
jgi:two-component system, LytTR family, response regulator